MNTTYDLINASQIIPAVQNFYNWSALYDDPTFFALLNNLGRAEVAAEPTGGKGKGNYRVEFNKLTGMKTTYTTAGVIDTAAGKINVKAINATSRLDTHVAFTLSNITPRVGLAFRVIGTIVDGAAAEKEVNAVFRINVVTATDDWTCECLDTNLSGVANADTCTSIKAGATIYVTDVAEFGGTAPTADDMATSQFYNYLQMYDISFGKNLIAMAQNTKYDNSMIPLQNAVQTRLFRSINTDLYYGELGATPGATSDYGTMKGLWGMLNLRNTSLDTDESAIVAKVDTGTTVDFWKLTEAVASRNYGSKNLLCLTTKEFSGLLAKSALAVNETVRTETINFPKYSVLKRSITVADTTLNLVCDNTLMSHPTFNDGTNTAGTGKMMICLDPNKVAIMYHQNPKLGVMIPRIETVLNARNQRTEESHILAALTLGLWDKAAHFAYGITGS